jgi:hypothetical protein
MILFMNEDAAYRYWVTHHRDGFVLDGRHRPRWAQLKLHRAACPQMKHASTKRTCWTKGTRFKACALNRQEIMDWVGNELGRPLENCPECSPDVEVDSVANEPRQLSHLAAEIVDYVLEVATIHLDAENSPYRLTVEAIAACMGKSPAQVVPTLKRLVDDGYLASDDHHSEKKAFRARETVYPTANALRMLPYFVDWPNESLQAELEKLRVAPTW